MLPSFLDLFAEDHRRGDEVAGGEDRRGEERLAQGGISAVVQVEGVEDEEEETRHQGLAGHAPSFEVRKDAHAGSEELQVLHPFVRNDCFGL